jgi:hypothetical protein
MNKPPTPKESVGAGGASGAKRRRLPGEASCPALAKVRVLLDEAEAARGCLIELPWMSSDHKNFILTVQWDSNLKDPVWTLYEETDSGSKVVWTQPFAAQDLEFMYDILSMSAGSAPGGLGIPDELKMKPALFEEAPKPKEEPSFDSFGAPSLTPFGSTAAPGGHTPPATSFPQAGFPAFPASAGSSYTSLPSLQPSSQPGYNNTPPAPYPQQQQQQQQPYPQQQQQPYPPQQQQPYPQQQQQGYPPQPPYPQQQQQQQQYPGYGQQQMPPGYPPNPYQQPQQQQQMSYNQLPQQYPSMPQGSGYPSEMNETKIPLDYHLIDKRANILLGTMLQEAGLISEPTLEAALKLQEMVRDEKMTPEKAPEVLKRLHAMGASIDQYLTKGDLDRSKGAGAASASKPAAQPSAKAPQGKGGTPTGGGRDLKGAFDLLQKAQLLTENDLVTANNVRKKHGGDLIQILEAAGKCNAKTVDAACTSLPLIREGLMKIEQVIMALNYCERMRVSFDDALDEMGWQNPRKIRTDLPL